MEKRWRNAGHMMPAALLCPFITPHGSIRDLHIKEGVDRQEEGNPHTLISVAEGRPLKI